MGFKEQHLAWMARARWEDGGRATWEDGLPGSECCKIHGGEADKLARVGSDEERVQNWSELGRDMLASQLGSYFLFLQEQIKDIIIIMA